MSLVEPRRLREDQRRLRASASQQSDGVAMFRQLLRQHLDESQIALGEKLHHQLLAGHAVLPIAADCSACNSATSSSRLSLQLSARP